MRKKRMATGVVPLDDETEAWLERLERDTGTPRTIIVASLLRDIRIDDERHDAPQTLH